MLDNLRDLFLKALNTDCDSTAKKYLIDSWNREIEHLQKIFNQMTDKK